MRQILHELGYTRTTHKLTRDNFFRYEGNLPQRWLSREMEISSTGDISIHVLSTERRKQDATKIARKLEEKIIAAGKTELGYLQKDSYEAQQLLQQLPVLAQS